MERKEQNKFVDEGAVNFFWIWLFFISPQNPSRGRRYLAGSFEAGYS